MYCVNVSKVIWLYNENKFIFQHVEYSHHHGEVKCLISIVNADLSNRQENVASFKYSRSVQN